ncbi:MAG: hypothetical protein GWN85_20390, partial [Gemmatimonadetes bacterium]|nr:hypothetical protein [Gemmatimonadota bacterium]
ATVTIAADATQSVSWEMAFEPAEAFLYPPRVPTGLEVGPAGAGAVRLTWRPEYYSIAGYQVEIDGRTVGVAFEPRAVLGALEPGAHTFAVRE